MRSLPPFPELVTFEAVARLGSVTRAAAELSITPSAVSHRLRRLEQHFGATLVQRSATGVRLTERGEALLPALRSALDHLARLGQPQERSLRVAAGSALCTWWLAGRLPVFQAHQPGVSVELIPLDANQGSIPECDVRIVWVEAGGAQPRPRQAELFTEAVFPVCSPDLLPGRRPARDPQVLRELPLLHKGVHGTGEWSWSLWFERLGLAPVPARAELRYADMSLLMSAAVDGAGLVVTRSLLAHDALAAGRLVPALEKLEPLPSTKLHVARWPSSRERDPLVAAFVEWLVREAQASIAATERLLGRGAAAPALRSRGVA